MATATATKPPAGRIKMSDLKVGDAYELRNLEVRDARARARCEGAYRVRASRHRRWRGSSQLRGDLSRCSSNGRVR